MPWVLGMIIFHCMHKGNSQTIKTSLGKNVCFGLKGPGFNPIAKEKI